MELSGKTSRPGESVMFAVPRHLTSGEKTDSPPLQKAHRSGKKLVLHLLSLSMNNAPTRVENRLRRRRDRPAGALRVTTPSRGLVEPNP